MELDRTLRKRRPIDAIRDGVTCWLFAFMFLMFLDGLFTPEGEAAFTAALPAAAGFMAAAQQVSLPQR